MSERALVTNELPSRLSQHRAEVEAIRSHARVLFEGTATGIQVASAISEATENFVTRVFQETVDRQPPDRREFIERNLAIIAVGGTGRGELCPYSDVDLLFLVGRSGKDIAADCVSQAVRDYWDAGLRLGHSVRGLGETVSLARQEIDVATSLVEARLLWGDRGLFKHLQAAFQKRIVRSRLLAFIDSCVAAREKERSEYGSAVKQLQPDVKRSPGGLRDLHLLRWVGFACFGVSDVESLRLLGALSRDEARILLSAYDFLKRVRVELHFAAGRCQDVLTRDDQLRITNHWGIEATVGQLPVERFMQMYFRHSTAIAELTERFITLHRPRSIYSRVVRFLATHRSEGIYLVGTDEIDVAPSHRDAVVASLEGILKFYRTTALYQLAPSAQFAERIREAVPHLAGDVSAESAQLFREILACHGNLGTILRSMFRTGVLEIVVPPMAHVRCLLQFNQYHSYTVDEHTLRTIEDLEGFDREKGLLGVAYRAVRNKYILHLAMLLHDMGKGYEEDHSIVGCAIAHRMAERLRIPDEDRETLTFLVLKHLVMAHQAFRRDNSEPEAVLEFSREVGSAARLRMLFTLTAADVMAVGPGVWTEWKSQLLSDLYDQTLVLLSGQSASVDQAKRLEEIKRKVLQIDPELASEESGPGSSSPSTSVPEIASAGAAHTSLLDNLPAHYLASTAPERIVADLRTMRSYQHGQSLIEGRFDATTQTVEYRILTHESDVKGCFHKATGVLTANRLEIISAQIMTTVDGFVVDSFRVHDGDFSGEVPVERIEEVAASMKSVLAGRVRVEDLFQRFLRFGAHERSKAVSNLPPRVVIDNNSSERFNVIDVFSHDRTGLLYTLSRKIFELELTVVRAKIATHLDQVVDVFYVADRTGRKLNDTDRLKQIEATLLSTLSQFECDEQLSSVS